ncbi:hypothetical protein DRQ36_08855 [bacterium]|nr:MAG: hypothetical protein DRQ36_08855 [bacterium]
MKKRGKVVKIERWIWVADFLEIRRGQKSKYPRHLEILGENVFWISVLDINPRMSIKRPVKGHELGELVLS